MAPPFEELQLLWQNQPQPAAAPLDIRGATDALRRFGRRQNVVNSLKAAAIAWQTWFCLSRAGVTPAIVVGQVVLVAGMANILLADWRTQLGIARLDFTSPSAGFIDRALERMRDPNRGFRRRLWLNLLLVIVGINLSFASRWAADPLQRRILEHLGGSGAPVIAFVLGLKTRAKRYAIEYRPIRERLMAMKQALEEQPQ
jgi:hypothetical protein